MSLVQPYLFGCQYPYNTFAYARDTSKKIKAVFIMVKAERGEQLGGIAPYGFTLDEDKLVINEKTAPIVQRIYALCLDGKGPSQIARILTGEHLLTHIAYEYQRSGKRGKPEAMKYPLCVV